MVALAYGGTTAVDSPLAAEAIATCGLERSNCFDLRTLEVIHDMLRSSHRTHQKTNLASGVLFISSVPRRCSQSLAIEPHDPLDRSVQN
jgi:hypothetical protein